jgi:hypothetical protein
MKIPVENLQEKQKLTSLISCHVSAILMTLKSRSFSAKLVILGNTRNATIHTCVNCKPRAMNSIGANGRQSKLRVEEEEVIRTTPKKHSRPKLDSNTKTQPLPNHAYASDSYEARVNLDSDDEPIMASPGQRTILNRKSETSGTSRVEKEPVSSVRCLCGFNTDPNVYYENSSREYILMRCDMCRLRQHGGCIGFFIPGDVPDCYYCEKCRPDMHTIQTHDDG